MEKSITTKRAPRNY